MLISGCVNTYYVPRVTPTKIETENEHFIANILPACTPYACIFIGLVIDNKSSKNIEIDWNRTFFIEDGITKGRFTFEDIKNPISLYAFLNRKITTIIRPGYRITVMLYPIAKVLTSYEFRFRLNGSNGVYLTVIVDGKEITEELLFDLSYIKTQNPENYPKDKSVVNLPED